MAQQLEITGHGYRSFFTTSITAGLQSLTAPNTFAVAYDKQAQQITITPAMATQEYAVAIYDIAGLLIGQGTNVKAISIPSHGIYIVQIVADQNINTFKLITY